MDAQTFLIILLIAAGLWFLWSEFFSGNKTNDSIEQQLDVKGNKLDPNLRVINTYFFEKDMFNFEKFCNYVLCIKEEMGINEIAQSIMELDLLLKCSGDLNDRIMSILIYSEAIIGVSYGEFDKVKQGIRDNKFKGTYQDLTYIYLSAIFYLKYLLAVKRGKFDSYNK